MTYNEYKDTLKTIQVKSKDHFHFTNDCFICHKTHNDSDMVAITIERLSGLVRKLYIENDYACKHCLHNLKERD